MKQQEKISAVCDKNPLPNPELQPKLSDECLTFNRVEAAKRHLFGVQTVLWTGAGY